MRIILKLLISAAAFTLLIPSAYAHEDKSRKQEPVRDTVSEQKPTAVSNHTISMQIRLELSSSTTTSLPDSPHP